MGVGVGTEISPFQRVGSHSRTEIKPGSQNRRQTEKMAESWSQSRTDFASTLQPWLSLRNLM